MRGGFWEDPGMGVWEWLWVYKGQLVWLGSRIPSSQVRNNNHRGIVGSKLASLSRGLSTSEPSVGCLDVGKPGRMRF